MVSSDKPGGRGFKSCRLATEVLTEPYDIPKTGLRQAVVVDPQGASFSLTQPPGAGSQAGPRSKAELVLAARGAVQHSRRPSKGGYSPGASRPSCDATGSTLNSIRKRSSLAGR